MFATLTLKQKSIVLGIIFLVIFILAGIFLLDKPKENEDGGVACTMEAKICPDGSAVGRTGPQCQFAPCPGEETVAESGGSIYGTVLLGPTCPVVMNPPDPKCADRPYSTQLVVTSADQSARRIKEFSSDQSGKFQVEVPPGEYRVGSSPATTIFPFCVSSEVVKVEANSSVEINVHCDTGIR